MPRKRNPDPNNPQDSKRWPNFFADPEAAQSLVQHPHFPALVADLRLLRLALEYDVIHTTPTMELTNFLRGQIAVCERIETLPEELAEWQKEHR
jgi:hypothetical protein